MITAIREFLRLESASGILLFLAAVLAMMAENSAADRWYDALLNTPMEIRVGAFEIAKPLLLWINDGLMAVFFFLIGLELKREVLQGELSNPSQIVLPVAAAVGGLFVPALIYIALNWGDAMALKGWAIPTATDIAFAMGVLSLLGARAPHALKLFLLTLAITDDLGAIVPHILVGLVLWVEVLKSGVHATRWRALYWPYSFHCASNQRRASHPCKNWSTTSTLQWPSSSCRPSPSPIPGCRWTA